VARSALALLVTSGMENAELKWRKHSSISCRRRRNVKLPIDILYSTLISLSIYIVQYFFLRM